MSLRYQGGFITTTFNGLLAPDAPTIGTATGGSGSASVAFTAPSNIGGGAITSYTVVSSPGGFVGTGASSPITVSGLTNGTAYTFTVFANNVYGNSPASAASNSVTPALTIDLLVVAGGGGSIGENPGNWTPAGGGGGGGVVYKTAYSATSGTSYTVTVGAGGAKITNSAGNQPLTGNAGTDSVFGSNVIKAKGGGGGGSYTDGGAGGCGGGGGVYSGAWVGGATTQASQGVSAGGTNYGFAGGDGSSGLSSGSGGGGGAGAAGSAPTSNQGADGGIGVSNSITGTATYYAGGGGGGRAYNGGTSGGAGGLGGGGAGAGSGTDGIDGTANTGGGGGGAYSTKVAGSGGSGVIIIRSLATAASTTGSPTVTTDGSYTVYKFTSSGSITF